MKEQKIYKEIANLGDYKPQTAADSDLISKQLEKITQASQEFCREINNCLLKKKKLNLVPE